MHFLFWWSLTSKELPNKNSENPGPRYDVPVWDALIENIYHAVMANKKIYSQK